MTGEIQIVLPPVSDDQISNDLVWLTEALVTTGAAEYYAGGILGGEYGYGLEFENDRFMLHPFCWCDQPDCDWCLGCECNDADYRFFIRGEEVSADTFYQRGGYSAGNCEHTPSCDYCTGRRKRAPNFLHKPSGSRIEWYKYIGRSMEVEINGNWRDILADCVQSLGPSA